MVILHIDMGYLVTFAEHQAAAALQPLLHTRFTGFSAWTLPLDSLWGSTLEV